MYWILSIPKAFSFNEIIQRSLPILYPPFYVQATRGKLIRIEHLSTGNTIALTLSHIETGLVLQTQTQLLGPEIEECSHKVWRMLRLDETFEAFRRAVRRTPELSSVQRWGARSLRGATLFEDIVTAVTVTWQKGGAPDYGALVWLVNRYGAPLPSNPTLHAFPEPTQLLRIADDRSQSLPVELAELLVWIARVFLEQRRQIERVTGSLVDCEQLEDDLTTLLHLPAESMGLVMLKLGRYDYIPNDAWARLRMQRYQAQNNGGQRQDVRDFFASWDPWGGLAYWLWDWRQTPLPSSLDLYRVGAGQSR